MTLYGSGGTGFFAYYNSGDGNVFNNVITGNSDSSRGLRFYLSSRNNVTNNTISASIAGSRGLGFEYNSNDNVVANNTISGEYFGVSVENSVRNDFTNTRSCYNQAFDFYDDGLNNTFVSSTYSISSPSNISYFGRTATCPFVGGMCGQTLIADTVLDADLTGCSGNGISIGDDNIVLNCQGHDITGLGADDSDYGIYLNNHTNVTIENCSMRDLTLAFILIRPAAIIWPATGFMTTIMGFTLMTVRTIIASAALLLATIWSMTFTTLLPAIFLAIQHTPVRIIMRLISTGLRPARSCKGRAARLFLQISPWTPTCLAVRIMGFPLPRTML